MKYQNLLIFCCSSLLTFCSLNAVGLAPNRILIDGLFEDWSNYPVHYTDANGDDGTSFIDFGRLKVANDDDFIFFYIETGEAINLQDDNEITIYLDTDNDVNTGFSIHGIGAEIRYTFGERYGVVYHSYGNTSIGHEDIQLVAAPTVSSNKFEIAIRRNSSIAGNPLFQGDLVNIVFKDHAFNGDVLPAFNDTVSYSFSTDNLGDLPSYSIQKPEAADLRIMSYNVLFDGLFEQYKEPAFTRIFQAIQPDIIGFQEIYDYSSLQVANQMEDMLPSDAGQQWYHAKEGPDCHAISRYPILASAEIAGYNSNAGNGAFLIDLPETQMLLIVAHPPCCSNNAGRQTEVDLIMKFVREAKDGSGVITIDAGAPIVILGDMNFVGYPEQLETLLTGNIENETYFGPDFNPDWNGADLEDSHPYVTGMPFSFTWYDEGSSFSPGRLDYIIYSGSNLVLQNKYTLFTPGLTSDSLATYNLLVNDVVQASDHLPVISDFKLDYSTSIPDLSAQAASEILDIHPNPAEDWTNLAFKLTKKGLVRIELLSQEGKVIHVLHQDNVHAGQHQLKFNTSSIPSGIYLIKMKTPMGTDVKRLIIQ